MDAELSYAGRTAAPAAQAVRVRVGGFGGVEGLARYLRDTGVTHLVDATHPFAAQMSAHAVAAAGIAGVPLLALTRPAWVPVAGDRWTRVPDVAGAVAALAGPPRRVMLALGRMHVAAFAAQPQHQYLLRFVDHPTDVPPLPHHDLVVDRGPFDGVGERQLMAAHRIELVVAKNAGGTGASAKIAAARALGLRVVMIDRPALPPRAEVHEVAAVFDWIAHGVHRGV